MAQFSLLPDDIHVLIIKKLFRNCWNLESFKQSLYLLAVNRTWRQLALPLVYEKAYIVYGTHQTLCDFDNKPNDNINLIQPIHLAKSISIELNYRDNPLPGLLKAATLSRCNAKRLELSLKPTLGFHKGSRDNVGPYKEGIAEFASRLAAVLPNITEISYSGTLYNKSASAFLGYIAGHYANQLTYINSNISFTTDKIFTQLTEFRLCMDYKDIPMPKIKPDNLAIIEMRNIHTSEVWKCFQFKSDAVFPNLAQLRVHYVADGPKKFPLDFPQLTTLRVSGACYPFFSQSKLPAHLKSLKIETTGEIYQQLQAIELPAVDNIEVSDSWGFDPEYFGCMNQLLRNGGKNVSLSFHNQQATLEANQFTCKHITKLSLGACVRFSTVLSIVARLPKLQTLLLLRFSDVNDQDTAELINILDPFATPIKQLVITYSDCSYELMVRIAINLALRLPQLKYLTVPQVGIDDFNLDSYTLAYPHVKNIKYELKDIKR